jgi:hypothetical protein
MPSVIAKKNMSPVVLSRIRDRLKFVNGAIDDAISILNELKKYGSSEADGVQTLESIREAIKEITVEIEADS